MAMLYNGSPFDLIPQRYAEALNAYADSLEKLKETGRCIEELFCESFSSSTHIHVAGDWIKMCDDLMQSISEEKLSSYFTEETFMDCFYDDRGLSLGKRNMWLRRRIYQNGRTTWSLKFNVQKNSDKIQYEEVVEPLEIAKKLYLSSSSKSTDVADLLQASYPFPIAKYTCVRVTCPSWKHGHHSVCFEMVKLSPKCYYSLLTLYSDENESASSTQETYSTVLSKVLASLAIMNERYFQLLFPGTPFPKTVAQPPEYFLNCFNKWEQPTLTKRAEGPAKIHAKNNKSAS